MSVVTVSLKSFLRTGALGPITTAWTAADIGRYLGPPTAFVVNEGELFPAYWAYDHLEISFAAQATDKPPYGMHFFQLEYAYRFKGRYAWAADGRLRVALEGLTARARLSTYARVLAEDPLATIQSRRFQGSSDWEVYLSTPHISAVFTTDLGDKAETPEALTSSSDTSTARCIEQHARVDSIYAYPSGSTFGPSSAMRRKNSDDWRQWSIAAFLTAIDQGGA